MLYDDNCFCSISSMYLLALPIPQRKQLSFLGKLALGYKVLEVALTYPPPLSILSDNIAILNGEHNAVLRKEMAPYLNFCRDFVLVHSKAVVNITLKVTIVSSF